MHAFILAGGFATRLWPLTEHRAKPLLPLAGLPLIEHLARDIPKDIPITVSTNAVFQRAFVEWAEQFPRQNIEILIEHTESDDQKLGALGATAQWIENAGIEDDILILAGDNYCGFSLPAFIEEHQPDTALIAVHDIGQLELAKSFGTVITEEDRVLAFEEKPKEPKTTLVNTGCYLLPKSMLPIVLEYARVKPDDIGGIFEELLRRDLPVRVFRFDDPWFDIGSFEAYLAATRQLVGTQVILGQNSTCDAACEDSVVIGAHSSVEQSTLRNVVLFDHCTVKDCILEDCIIDSHCHLEGIDLRKQMLRRGTKLRKQPPRE